MPIVTRRALTGALVAVTVAGCASSCTASHRAVSAPPGAAAAAGDTAGTTVEWPVTRCGTLSGTGCAPTAKRVDLKRPAFSHPTKITNPLFPISSLNSVVLLGKVEGLPFRSETTLLPGRHTVTVDGKEIEVAVSQYTAYLDGRIDEVAIDRYAQDDDGSVWYFGEDVFDYRNGAVAITEGTWLAGRDGPPAMIMPAHPRVGDVFRAENVTGVVFEEITVKAINQTVNGPRGPITGAAIMAELHNDGATSNKVFAPGYGEFYTSNSGEVEALSLAVPTDKINEPVLAELRRVSTGAWGVLENARLGDWDAANQTLKQLQGLWAELRSRKYPPLVVEWMTRELKVLATAVTKEDVNVTSLAAVDVAQSALDLELLYRGNVEIDRFHLHAQQLRVLAAMNDPAGVRAEVATLEWIRDRLAGLLNSTQLANLDAELRALRAASDAKNVQAAADHAATAAAGIRRG
jgi:hypothetical protein